MAQRFLATDGNIREVLSALFRSPEFMDSKNYNAKFKTPYQYVVSAYRATGSEVSSPVFVQNVLQQLGMPLFGCQTPDGYKNTQAAWLNPDGMTRRLSFATSLTKLPNSKLQTPNPERTFRECDSASPDRGRSLLQPNATGDRCQSTATSHRHHSG